MMVLNTPTLAFSPRFNLARGGALEESDERLGGKRRRETGELRELGKSSSAQGGGKQRRLSSGELRHMLPVKHTIRDVAT